MSKNLKVLGVIILVVAFGVAGWFFTAKQSQNNAEVKKENQQEEKQVLTQDEQDLVWYEIPELNIKFKMPKEMASLIGYRDFYVMDTKADGKELYIKNLDNDSEPIIFAQLILDKAARDKTTDKYQFLSQYCLGNEGIKILITKQNEYRVCYLDRGDDKKMVSSVKDRYSNQSYKFDEKLLRGYLKRAPVAFIK